MRTRAMLKKLLLALVLIIAGIGLFALTKPDRYVVTRSTVINAPPARVFAIVNDFHHFPNWSPWQILDPAMQVTHSGAASGVGAKYAWKGNQQVGSGTMEIIESVPDRKVGMDLRFIEPFASRARTDIDIAPHGHGAKVSWTIDGEAGYITKLMMVFVSMEKMMTPDFDAGLANLKREAEAAP